VRCVRRRQDHGTPKVDDLARGQVPREFVPGTDLDVLLAENPRVLEGQALDADVPVGGTSNPRHLRLVGVQTPTGSGFFRTNLPPRVGPRQVADLDRVRWEVELRMQLATSGPRLDAWILPQVARSPATSAMVDIPCTLLNRLPETRGDAA
jgi:hypothetical protein